MIFYHIVRITLHFPTQLLITWPLVSLVYVQLAWSISGTAGHMKFSAGARCDQDQLAEGVKIMRLVSELEVFNWLHN